MLSGQLGWREGRGLLQFPWWPLGGSLSTLCALCSRVLVRQTRAPGLSRRSGGPHPSLSLLPETYLPLRRTGHGLGVYVMISPGKGLPWTFAILAAHPLSTILVPWEEPPASESPQLPENSIPQASLQAREPGPSARERGSAQTPFAWQRGKDNGRALAFTGRWGGRGGEVECLTRPWPCWGRSGQW